MRQIYAECFIFHESSKERLPFWEIYEQCGFRHEVIASLFLFFLRKHISKVLFIQKPLQVIFCKDKNIYRYYDFRFSIFFLCPYHNNLILHTCPVDEQGRHPALRHRVASSNPWVFLLIQSILHAPDMPHWASISLFISSTFKAFYNLALNL